MNNIGDELDKHFRVPESDQEKPPIVLYEDKITLGTGAFQIARYTHKNVRIITGVPDDEVMNSIVNTEGNNLILGHNHAILSEYEKALQAAGKDCVHIYGFKSRCKILLNDHETQDAKDVLKMYKEGVPPYAICTYMGCGDNGCEYPPMWRETREEGVIAKTILAPSNYAPIFNFDEFNNVFIIGDNTNVRLFPLKFNEEKIITNLRKLEKYVLEHIKDEYLLKYDDLELIIQAIQNKDVVTLYAYIRRTDDAIRRYNVHLMSEENEEDESDENLDSKIEQACIIRMSNVIMYLDFYKRKQRHQAKEDRYKLECLIEGAFRELALSDGELHSWKQHQQRLLNHPDQEEVRQTLEFTEKEIHDLQIHKEQIVREVESFAMFHGFSDIFSLPPDTDLYRRLERLKNKQITEQPKTEDIPVNFPDALFYRHLSSSMPVTIQNTEIQFRQSFFLEDIFNFQKLFPEYKSRVTIQNTEKKNPDSKLILGKFNGMYSRKFFEDPRYKDEREKLEKHHQNKLQYLDRQGKNPCTITYSFLIVNGKYLGYPAYGFGTPTGITKYEKHDAVLVLGTHMPGNSIYHKMWDRYFALEHGEMPKIEFVKNDVQRTYVPNDERLKRIFDAFIMPQTYAAICNVRPHDSAVEIYWYGYNIPEPLFHELTFCPL
jgi:hypothetical protein